MATFGPLFHIAMGYALLAGSAVASALSIRWADRVGHLETAAQRSRRDARIGQVLSGVSLLFVLYYTGAWVFLILLWPLVLSAGLLVWGIHKDRIDRAAASREAGR